MSLHEKFGNHMLESWIQPAHISGCIWWFVAYAIELGSHRPMFMWNGEWMDCLWCHCGEVDLEEIQFKLLGFHFFFLGFICILPILMIGSVHRYVFLSEDCFWTYQTWTFQYELVCWLCYFLSEKEALAWELCCRYMGGFIIKL